MSNITSLQIGQNKIQMCKDNFPSDRYIDITLNGTGTKYTAPADGWVTFQGNLTGNNTFFAMVVGKLNATASQYTGGGQVPNGFTLPINKGQTVEFIYNCTVSTLNFCRFIYSKSALAELEEE